MRMRPALPLRATQAASLEFAADLFPAAKYPRRDRGAVVGNVRIMRRGTSSGRVGDRGGATGGDPHHNRHRRRLSIFHVAHNAGHRPSGANQGVGAS